MCVAAVYRAIRGVLWASLIGLVGWGGGSAQAQPASYVQHQWTTQDGLPVNSVRDIAQGPQGYLWMATYDGLVRFDGTRFETWTPSNSRLPGRLVRQVRMGPRGHLWLRMDGYRLVEVDPYRPAVVGVYGSGAGGIAERAVLFAAGPEGTVWLGTRANLYRRTPADTAWHPTLPDSASVLSVETGPEGSAWAGTAKRGLWRATPDTALQVVKEAPGGDPLRDLSALAVRANGAWVGGEGGAYRVRENHITALGRSTLGGRKTVHLDVTSGPAGDTTVWILDHEGRLFATSGAGVRPVGNGPVVGAGRVVRTGPHGARWTVLGRRVLRDGRLVFRADRKVRRLLYGRDGNWWVGTGGDGLYRLRRTPITMVDSTDGLPSENVYGLAPSQPDSQAVHVGSIGGGLVRVRDSVVTPLSERWNLPDIVWTAAQERNGQTTWIGTDTGLYRHTGETTAPVDLPGLDTESVRAVHTGTDGPLRLLEKGALYSRRDGSWQRRTRGVPNRANALFFRRVRNGSLWIGTGRGGLLRLRDGELSQLSTEEGLPAGPFLSAYEDSAGLLWVGTGHGLVCIDRKGTPRLDDDERTVLTQQHGLPDNVIIGVVPDDRGRLWMSTHQGIFRVERSALAAVVRGRRSQVHPVTYTERDGLGSREANGAAQRAAVRTSDGRLWVPTQAGVAVVDPSATRERPPPPVAIEALAPAETEASDTTYQVSPTDTLRLDPEQRTFTVRYAGLNFSRPAATRFEVQLEGFDRVPTRTPERTVRYTEVDPGTYRLRVRAAGARGVFGPPAHLTITVAPFWWETWWFYGLCGLGVIGLAVGGYRWRTRRLRRRQDKLEQTVVERTEEVRRQRNELEEQAGRLQALDEAKSRFFANLSHEFRTPLTLIRGPLQEVREHLERGTLADVSADADEDAEQLSIAERNAARLQRLVDQLLGLARMEAGTYDLDARPTDVGERVGRIVRGFEPLAERAGIALTAEGASGETDDASESPGTSEPVYVDREALERIVSNLLSNAIKFTSEGGRVSVTVRERDDAVELAVQDTGVGIPEDKQAAIFDRFSQTDDTLTREQEGVGIGLALTQDLVELHGGTITLDSVEGQGTTVTVRLPRGTEYLTDDQIAASRPPDESAPANAPEEEKPPSFDSSPSTLDSGSSRSPDRAPAPDSDTTPAEHAPGAPADSSKLVLVVDDNADVRRYVRSVLEPEFAVTGASTGGEGVSAAREHRPDVILADVMMPEMDGHEMTRRLKSDPETEAIPVIMVTARAETQDEATGLRVGADDYVTKPFDADVLRQRVGGVLALQQRLRRRLEEELQGAEERPEDTADEERPEIVQAARRVAREHLTDPEFDVGALANEMAMSRSTLYRKLRDASDHTPSSLLTAVRIETARDLLATGEPVSQVAYAVGYNTLSTFSRVFREETGTPPSTYAEAEA